MCSLLLCRYWELVETLRRILLTAVISVCATGTNEQAVISLLIALFYIKLYGSFAPYDRIDDDILAETGQFQIFFTFLFVLLMQGDLIRRSLREGLGVFMIIVNFAVFAVASFLELKSAREEHLEENELWKKPVQKDRSDGKGSARIHPV